MSEQKTEILEFKFDEAEPVTDRREILNYLQCTFNGKWFEPPISLNTLSNTFSASSYHSSPIYVKRNILTRSFISHKYLSTQSFSRLVLDYLSLGNCYLENKISVMNTQLGLEPVLAKYTRRGLDLNRYYFLTPSYEEHEFKKGKVWHLLSHDINQEIYGVPEYLAAINSIWLDKAATTFRRRYYINGSHAGFILYLSNPTHNEKDIDSLKESLRQSRGPGNFRNLVIYSPNGKPEGLKLIPIGEVAAKDNFGDIKSVSRDDILTAHRVPPSLMGVIPSNVGGLGDPEKASKVFYENEIQPLQEQFRSLNDWLGIDVIRFKEPASN